MDSYQPIYDAVRSRDALEGEGEKNEQDKNDADALKDAMDDMRQHGDY